MSSAGHIQKSLGPTTWDKLLHTTNCIYYYEYDWTLDERYMLECVYSSGGGWIGQSFHVLEWLSWDCYETNKVGVCKLCDIASIGWGGVGRQHGETSCIGWGRVRESVLLCVREWRSCNTEGRRESTRRTYDWWHPGTWPVYSCVLVWMQPSPGRCLASTTRMSSIPHQAAQTSAIWLWKEKWF